MELWNKGFRNCKKKTNKQKKKTEITQVEILEL